jgi:hypothetical protein
VKRKAPEAKMCHTTLNTHLICLHTTSSTTKCTAASGYLIPTFISLLFSPPKCTKTSSKEYTDAFCSTCTETFKQYSINEQETRARILRYREKNNYYGALTPFANEDGAVEFLKKKTNANQREHGPGERTEFDGNGNGNGNGEKETREQLERWWGAESSNDVESTPPQLSRSRRNSNSSTCTVWPGPWPGSTQALSSPSDPSSNDERQSGARRGSEADIGMQSLDRLGLVEVDDFGHEIENPVPPPACLVRDEVRNINVFELKDLETELPESMSVESSERPKVTKPLQPFPMEEPQRRSGDERKLC